MSKYEIILFPVKEGDIGGKKISIYGRDYEFKTIEKDSGELDLGVCVRPHLEDLLVPILIRSGEKFEGPIKISIEYPIKNENEDLNILRLAQKREKC